MFSSFGLISSTEGIFIQCVTVHLHKHTTCKYRFLSSLSDIYFLYFFILLYSATINSIIMSTRTMKIDILALSKTMGKIFRSLYIYMCKEKKKEKQLKIHWWKRSLTSWLVWESYEELEGSGFFLTCQPCWDGHFCDAAVFGWPLIMLLTSHT